jgi:hypothetical protein
MMDKDEMIALMAAPLLAARMTGINWKAMTPEAWADFRAASVTDAHLLWKAVLVADKSGGG